MNDVDPFALIEALLLTDPGNRGVANLLAPGDLKAAAESLRSARRAIIVTGFFIPTAQACETDGPPGAWTLGEGLRRLGAEVKYVTDAACARVLEAAGFSPLWMDDDALDQKIRDFAPTHAVAIERAARAADGRYYTMRAIDNTANSTPLDRFFVAGLPGCMTIGIGDGGNEIGMGKVRDQVRRTIPHGAIIGATVGADRLIVAGVSNWGAWGLTAGLSLLAGEQLLPSERSAFDDLQRVVDAGAVDGVTGQRQATVDGIAWPVHARMLASLHALAGVGQGAH